MTTDLTNNDLSYGAAARYPATMHDGQKAGVPGIDTVPYMMNNGDRSISPIATSPHATTSAPMGHFPFAFPTGEAQEHSEADYHAGRLAAAPELRLHGGTADISAFSMNRRRTNTGPERPMLGSMPAYHHAGGDAGTSSPGAGGQGTVSPASIVTHGVRRRRSTGASNGMGGEHSSRSPSPPGAVHPPISSTLAVIKAQAFGALRRTRARNPRKGADGGSVKLALGALEARGIGLGLDADDMSPGSKRMRISEDDGGQF